MARALYARAPLRARALARLRPTICPFERILPLVPRGAAALDIGCGAGLWLGLLAELGRIRSGLGIDADARAIAVARAMAAARPAGAAPLAFSAVRAEDPWPAGGCDAVCLIDVLHHLPREIQLPTVARAARAVPPGGVLIYKDMAPRPLGYALANRAHDLLLAHDWIHHRPLSEVERTAQAEGLAVDGARPGRAPVVPP